MIGRSPRSPRSPRSRRSRGYTAVEVLIALTLFAVGTAGVLSLQRASIVGSADARRSDVASAIASEWLERLRQDSLAWNLPNAANPGAASNHGTATKYLGVVVDGPTGTSDAGAASPWITPAVPGTQTDVDRLGSPSYDIVGRALVTADVPNFGVYCTQYRLQWISYDNSGPLVIGGMMRAEVRVLYLTSGDRLPCAALTGDPPVPAGFPTGYKSINMTIALRQNP